MLPFLSASKPQKACVQARALESNVPCLDMRVSGCGGPWDGHNACAGDNDIKEHNFWAIFAVLFWISTTKNSKWNAILVTYGWQFYILCDTLNAVLRNQKLFESSKLQQNWPLVLWLQVLPFHPYRGAHARLSHPAGKDPNHKDHSFHPSHQACKPFTNKSLYVMSFRFLNTK